MFPTHSVFDLHTRAHVADSCMVYQECFTFEHPNRDEVIDNTRYIKMAFEQPKVEPSSDACAPFVLAHLQVRGFLLPFS